MKYFSVCSGIEAASVAWEPLGWTPVGFSEIEPFPSAVLEHHYPKVNNYGDLTKWREWGLAPGSVDVLVGGTPCQSFSVAGLRKGLADPRGNLALVFLALADHLRPKWIVWENVPGVLSSDGGRDFGALLGALGELGYGWAYRVLDAQYFGVPQRRRRVFVVASPGDSSEELIPRVVGALSDGAHMGGGLTDRTPIAVAYSPSVSLCLNAGAMGRRDAETETLIATGGYFKAFDPQSAVSQQMAVRRLTPRECERLQGFPDHYTRIPWKKRPAEDCPDGPRYKALGNSMAVPVMRWIAQRIMRVAHE